MANSDLQYQLEYGVEKEGENGEVLHHIFDRWISTNPTIPTISDTKYLCSKHVTDMSKLLPLAFMEQTTKNQDVFQIAYCLVCKEVRLEKFPFPAEKYLI